MDQGDATAELQRLRAQVASLQADLTQAQAQAAACDKDARYWRRIVESLPEFLAIFDAEGRFIYLNYIGPDYQGQEYIGHSLADVVDPVYWRQAFAAAMAGQRTQYEAHDARREHFFRCTVGPVTFDDGQTYLLVVSQNIDELKQAERDLQDSRELWNSLVNNSPDTILIMDPDSRVLFINRPAPGYTDEEIIGRLGVQFVEEPYRAPLLKTIRAAAETGQPQFSEMRDVRAKMWWLVTHVPVRDSRRGDLVLTISQDFTERRKTELALHESEARLRLLLTQVPAIVWTIDRQLNILSADGAGLAMIGMEEQHWRGKSLHDMYQTTDPTFPPLAAHLTALMGKSATYEQTIGEHHFHKQVEPLRDASGHIIGALGVGVDVSARKATEEEVRRARDELERRVNQRTAELDAVNQNLLEDIAQRKLVEQQLRDSEERFRAIADTVPVAIVITRFSDGKVVYVNQRLCALFDVGPNQLLGRKAIEFYVEPDRRSELLDRLQQAQTVLDLELWLQSPQGKRMLVSGSYQPIVFDGQPCVLTGFIDLTKRIETENELRAERRLLKRLLELHERERQLISYEVHDGIVQDMTAALMFFEASRPDDTEEPPANFANGLRLLRGSIDEARRIINGLRPPVLEDEGVVAAIQSLVAEMERDAGLEIELIAEVKFHRLAPALEMAIYRIVQEGLNNVWHHSRSPKARVELMQRDDIIEIRIRDEGVGFDPKKVSKRRYGLMGMRERARLLNGRATVRSAPGEGTLLDIELPLIDTLMPSSE